MSLLQCVAMCCSVLQCIAVRCVALRCVAVQCSGEGGKIPTIPLLVVSEGGAEITLGTVILGNDFGSKEKQHFKRTASKMQTHNK